MYRSYTVNAHLVLQIESPIIKCVTVEIHYHPRHTYYSRSIKSNSTIKKKRHLLILEKLSKKINAFSFALPCHGITIENGKSKIIIIIEHLVLTSLSEAS